MIVSRYIRNCSLVCKNDCDYAFDGAGAIDGVMVLVTGCWCY